MSVEDRQLHKYRQIEAEAKEIQEKMFYFQDKRTDLCYAYYWGGAANGGPAITLVPRDKVEKFLVNK